VRRAAQRFGSAANLNIHLHCLVLDGVYRRGTDGAPEFVEVPAPTDEALQAVSQKIFTRMMKLLTRRGVLVEEQGQTHMADNDSDSDEARARRPLQAAAWPCRPRRASGPTPRQAQTVHWTVCVRARRLHLIRFHGVQAPNAKLRALVVPQEPLAPAAPPAQCEANCAHHSPVPLSWARVQAAPRPGAAGIGCVRAS